MNVELTPEEEKDCEARMDAMGFEKVPSSDTPRPLSKLIGTLESASDHLQYTDFGDGADAVDEAIKIIKQLNEKDMDTPKPSTRWCSDCKAPRKHRLNAIGMVICVECGVDNT